MAEQHAIANGVAQPNKRRTRVGINPEPYNLLTDLFLGTAASLADSRFADYDFA
jgi:hypothetical protein